MKKKRPAQIHIELEAVAWGRIKGLKARLESAAELTLAALPDVLLPAAQLAQMNLLLTTDRAVQTLNHDFRGKNKPTNVLSFPGYERKDLIRAAKQGAELHAGDIAIAYAYVAKEARAERKDLLDHVTHLMIHGILHLFGYDHDTPAKAARMEKLEKELMASLGLPDPYASLEEGVAAKPRKKRAK